MKKIKPVDFLLALPAIIAILFACSCSAQIRVTKIDFHESIVLKADTMTVSEGFQKLDMLCAGSMWYFNRVVEKDGHSYLRYGIPLFRKPIYMANEKGKYKRIKKGSV